LILITLNDLLDDFLQWGASCKPTNYEIYGVLQDKVKYMLKISLEIAKLNVILESENCFFNKAHIGY